MLDVIKPEIRCVAKDGDSYAKFVVQPLERGFGTTLGTSLRRVLLSFIPGAAITSVQIDGVLHEFSTIPGVLEDVLEIVLNLKEIYIRVDENIYPDSNEPIVLSLQRSGKGKVIAADVGTPTGVTIVNPAAPIATLADEGASLSMTLTVERGRGYLPTDGRERHDSKQIGAIPIDAIFCPTKKVSFQVEPTRKGSRTDLDRLVLEVWTNGTISSHDAVTSAAHWLDNYLRMLFTLPEEVAEEEEVAPVGVREPDLLRRKTETIEFSVRTAKCLKKENIETLQDLISRAPSQLLSIKNFGEKSLNEVKEKLAQLGLSLHAEAP